MAPGVVARISSGCADGLVRRGFMVAAVDTTAMRMITRIPEDFAQLVKAA